ncbi:hypothetical protein [Leucobacter ruminantium]|uniref:DUF3987 domain-containing protein n=1 Tax=Leucobacter ruminantium TaxID=1289170 RepID=A0A939LXL7_9MICO|nr:hypothetical protein [Leucobacter ruminantium]MBO1805966.1 hypothetical protein [Leucobacter ruminantium]
MTAEQFWSVREHLVAIHQQARARRVSPWSTLGAVLAMVIARVDPKVSLPAIVGGRGSCNLFVSLVGISGGGKGASIAAAADLLDFRGDRLVRADHRTLGSGEGISAAFVERVKGEDGTEIVHHTDGVLFEVAEVDTLSALGSRAGSSLMPELRKMWSGERLGFQNRDRATSLPVEAHSYRAALIVGVQPARSAAILDDAAGGTPQRFVWFSTEDPDAPDRAPAPPARIRWENPAPSVIPNSESGMRGMQVCDTAWTAIERAQVQRLRGDGHALDGHALLSRLKVAAALALLEMRGDVNDEDWELAGVIMQHSDQTRQKCVDALTAVSRQANAQRAELRAEAVVKTDDHLVAKCKERIVSKLGDEWIGSGALRPKITAKLREHFEVAVTELVESGAIEVAADQYQGQDRTRYRLAVQSALTKSSALPIRPDSPRNHADLSTDKTALTKSSALPAIVSPDPSESRVCAVCGGSLEGKRPHAITCSDTCRKRLSTQNRRANP